MFCFEGIDLESFIFLGFVDLLFLLWFILKSGYVRGRSRILFIIGF